MAQDANDKNFRQINIESKLLNTDIAIPFGSIGIQVMPGPQIFTDKGNTQKQMLMAISETGTVN